MPENERLRDEHTPPWDIKREREHEVANPGPSTGEALKEGRRDGWNDPSENKIRQPGSIGEPMQTKHEHTILGAEVADGSRAEEVRPTGRCSRT